jgi:site-specific DNA-adenine methylase
MVYLGSKSRIAKHIVPILQKIIDDNNIQNYYEPFIGGANIIDKIKCTNRYGSDINKYLIALLQARQDSIKFPKTISEEEYKQVKNNMNGYEDWYIGLVGFLSSFSTKFFNGYARTKGRDIPNERIRNFIKQDISNINLSCQSYESLIIKPNSLVYCDIPYKSTTSYKGTNSFDYEKLYLWCKQIAKHSTVIISEYDMPDEFECILEINHNVNFASNRDSKDVRIEKLYKA